MGVEMRRRGFLAGVVGGVVGWPLVGALGAAEEEEKVERPGGFGAGSWVLAVLPDTQHYSQEYPGLLELQTLWLAENARRYNIKYVLTLGDITNTNSQLEWERAGKAFGRLEGVVPYTVVLGNHDYGDRGRTDERVTKADGYFPAARFEGWGTFGGTMAGRIENNYHLFEAGGEKWLIVNLEWGPRDLVLEWADSVLGRHGDRKAIVATHAYLYSDSTRYDWAGKGGEQKWNPHVYPTKVDTNDGQEMWEKVLRRHGNLRLVINGHVLNDGLGFQVSRGDAGNGVNEMLVNFQTIGYGGDGWLRLMEFRRGGAVEVRDYSPVFDRWNEGEENRFGFEI